MAHGGGSREPRTMQTYTGAPASSAPATGHHHKSHGSDSDDDKTTNGPVRATPTKKPTGAVKATGSAKNTGAAATKPTGTKPSRRLRWKIVAPIPKGYNPGTMFMAVSDPQSGQEGLGVMIPLVEGDSGDNEYEMTKTGAPKNTNCDSSCNNPTKGGGGGATHSNGGYGQQWASN